VAIRLGHPLPDASAQPTRTTDLKTGLVANATALSLLGFAPDGVYHATAVTGTRGGLLPHPFTLTIYTYMAVCFLRHFPSGWRCYPFPRPDIIRHRVSMEPGLSSAAAFRPVRQRPPGRLARLT
jgi:hypothetical protein